MCDQENKMTTSRIVFTVKASYYLNIFDILSI